ncbi:MAG: hypothetical protein GY754_25430 [bacterium]|nr:hypothetical protein [bacterium]
MKKIYLILILLFISMGADAGSIWKTYFTGADESIEGSFVKVIAGSKKSIYGAFFEISSPGVIEAFIQAKKRGIIVQLVTDMDYYNSSHVDRLIKAGISIVPDNKKSLMHNKFAVIDRTTVWTGSYNLTPNGSNKNNNNAIKIDSPALADLFYKEFLEMYRYKIFGNKKDYGPFAAFRKNNSFAAPGLAIDAYFSPEDMVEDVIISRIEKARKSIRFMAFSFTSKKISETIIKKHKQGIPVYGIFETRGAKSKYAEYVKMLIEGLPVKLDKNRYTMHHKVIIIDDEQVITGSFNFSKNANLKNDENTIIIKNRSIAEKYVQEFNRLY